MKSKVGIVETEANNIQTKFSSECEATSKNITDKANAALAKINSDLEVLCSHYKTSSENASALINSSVTEGINTLNLAVVKAQEDLCNSTKTEEGKLNTAFAQLTSSVEELQANFRNESSRLIDDQKSSLTEAATAFSNKIAGHVQSLTDLESQLKTILTQASFEAIQTKIGEVKATVLSTKDSFDSSLSAFKTTCENWNTTQIESLTQFIQKIDSLDSSLSALKTSCESWSNEQKESDKEIKQKIDSLSTAVSGLKTYQESAHTRIKNKLTGIENSIVSLSNKSRNDYTSLSSDLKSLSNELKEVKSQNSTLKILVMILIVLSIVSFAVGFIK